MDASGSTKQRRDAGLIFEAAVAAVSPAVFLPAHLPAPPASGQLAIFAAGKAAGAMAAAAEAFYLDQHGFPVERLSGAAISRHGYGLPLKALHSLEAGHPVPDDAGLAATEALINHAKALPPETPVVFLLSGGASACLVAPAAGLTLADKQALTRTLLRAGVPIDGMNILRKHLSRVKGGRLAGLITGRPLTTLALSDVPGDDLSLIGSGPTIPDPSTLDDARGVLARFGITPAPAIAAALANPAQETPKPGDAIFAQCTAKVVARPADAFAAACAKAQALGYQVVDLGASLEGEARDVAKTHAGAALRLRGQGQRLALISGGELTVTLKGNGRGGPNQEYALALAIALDGACGIAGLSGDTDGTDGGVGAASDPAGAFFDASTLGRAAALGLDAGAMLENNDSTGFFGALGDLHTPGPTFTNANDLRIILIED